MPPIDSSAFDARPIGWFDNVRVRVTPETEAAAVAGRQGVVTGQTVPSTSGVEDVIGTPTEDYAVHVLFEDTDEGFWFAEHLLELVDHAPGSTITIGSRTLVRDASGEWREVPTKAR
jgi:hypothetical protein